MYARFLLPLFGIIFYLFGLNQALANPSADALVAHFKKVNSFKAEFNQVVHNKQAGSKEQTSGILTLKGEKLFRLEYTKPYKQTYVADGTYMWFFDEDLEQVTVRLQNTSDTDTPALILSQPERFIKKYQVSMVKQDGKEMYTLFTTSEQTAFDKIYLDFKNDKLLQMTLYDNFGSETKLTFKNLQYNIPTTDKTFKFIVPNGVDVIRQIPEAETEDETE